MNAEYRLIQDGMTVAQVDGPTVAAYREIKHYAAVYSQDGPVRIEQKIAKAPNKWQEIWHAHADH